MINLLQNLPQVDLSQTLRQSLPTAERISQWDNIGRQNAMRGMLSDYAANPNAKADDYLAIAQQYPELIDQFKPAWQGLNEQEKKQKQSFLSQLNMSMASGDQEQALQLIDDQMKTYQDRNDTEEVGGLTSLKDLIQKNPGQAATSLGMALYSGLTPQQIEEHQNKLNEIKAKALQAQASASKSLSDQKINEAKFPTELQKAQAQTQLYGAQAQEAQNNVANSGTRLSIQQQEADTNAQNAALRSKEFENKIAQGRPATPGQLAFQRKIADEATGLNSALNEFNTYLNNLKNSPDDAKAGIWSDLANWYKNQTGNQDEYTAARIYANKLGISELLKSAAEIKPVSNSDLELLGKGLPPASANKQSLLKYYSAVQKVMQYNAISKDFLAEYVAQNNYQPSQAVSDLEVPIVVNGDQYSIKIPKGTAYARVTALAKAQAAKIIKGQADGQAAPQPNQSAPNKPPIPSILQNFMQRRGQ